MKILVIVDMQNDFVTGPLGTKEAQELIPNIIRRIIRAFLEKETIFLTRDTHNENYLETAEGKNLPIPHCIKDTEGWQIVPDVGIFLRDCQIFDKPTFGSLELAEHIKSLSEKEEIEKVTLIGLCTDICVISNALLLKAYLPEVEIAVKASCCAGTTIESHLVALSAMNSCQISIE